MQIYYNLNQLPQFAVSPVISAGNFDGVHLGHQALLGTMRERARLLGAPALAITFNPHPLALLRPDKSLNMICSLEQRFELLARFGADITLCLTFDQKLADLSAEDFIRIILVEKLKVKEVVEGYDFNFGKQGRGNVAFLREMGKTYNYVVHQVEPVIIENQPVSSSRIRKSILGGQLDLANEMLGHPYRIAGVVIHGEGRGGPVLKMPTANLQIEPAQLLPPQGVYAARIGLADGRVLHALFNLGINPTFSEIIKPRIEVHIPHFEGNLYNQKVWVEPVAFLRPERKFDSPAELMRQVVRDIDDARRYNIDRNRIL